jgi:hypothetical protein
MHIAFQVTDLAGVGEVLGRRLEGKGFDKANVVLGQFLLLKKNKDLFVEWIKVSSLCTYWSPYVPHAAGLGQRQHQAVGRLLPVPGRLVGTGSNSNVLLSLVLQVR